MTQTIIPVGIPCQSETRTSEQVVRVLRGGKPWTALEADPAELVHPVSSRLFVMARRELRKIECAVSNSAQ